MCISGTGFPYKKYKFPCTLKTQEDFEQFGVIDLQYYLTALEEELEILYENRYNHMVVSVIMVDFENEKRTVMKWTGDLIPALAKFHKDKKLPYNERDLSKYESLDNAFEETKQDVTSNNNLDIQKIFDYIMKCYSSYGERFMSDHPVKVLGLKFVINYGMNMKWGIQFYGNPKLSMELYKKNKGLEYDEGVFTVKYVTGTLEGDKTASHWFDLIYHEDYKILDEV